ncbi:DUF2231 domain-containing protein [Sulfobacillus harzensis]|uniref:DUF2231 domain-containing protein n=1 Tax=Sulfobacillus harzensis TaxID=2729629 RepID=A0A7Y0L0A5_9FIRM|nr:DUF2231 domain-containing protein [Sulfobacillus harzensis]NMP20860.1 DUF2231 domain-containing protein [Sulfobacillus harzensis]
MIPATVHPMIVHFPIALLFTAFLLDLIAIWRQDRDWAQAAMVLLWLTLISVVFAIAAGLYAETKILVPPTVRPILAAHRRDGLITGALIAVVVILRMRTHAIWRTTAKGNERLSWSRAIKPWYPALGAYALGLIMISATGVVGGSMVYDHGLGVATAPAPNLVSSAKNKPPVTPATNSGNVAAGRALYASTCSRCHGPTPPFTHSLVSSMGASGMENFISTRMPPGNPVSKAAAKQLVAYFNSL